jgi:hypothetical protein
VGEIEGLDAGCLLGELEGRPVGDLEGLDVGF